MISDFATKLARVITEYSTSVKAGETVTINTSVAGIPAAQAVLSAVLKRGGHPAVSIRSAELAETFFLESNDEQIRQPHPLWLHAIEIADVLIGIDAAENTFNVAAVPEDRLALAREGQQAMNKEMWKHLKKDPDFRWFNVPWPTQAHAQAAKMGLASYRAFAYEAMGLNHDDPVAHWKGLKAQQDRLIAWCAGKSRVEIKGPGVDLSFDISERPWGNYHGQHHLPDGEIFTCPLEDSVNGTIAFNLSTYDMDDVQLTFKNGSVVEASARHQNERLQNLLDTDAGTRRIGMFGIGTNPGIKQITGFIFDLKMRGTIHFVMGQSMPEGGGQNESATQFTFLHDMRSGGEIWIDGELFYKDGAFQVE